MIIIPTEKRFDWKHAPVVLFGLVVLNILIFFGYQFGDNAKIYDALIDYKQKNFLEQEWPVYQKYLKQNNLFDRLDADTELYKDKTNPNSDYLLLYNIVTDSNFYSYLEKNTFDLFELNFIEKWSEARLEINSKIQSVSTLAYGLIPAEMNIGTLFTHQFLHGGIMHLLGNLFFLVICGFAVEAAIGHFKFLMFYLASGVAGGLLFAALDMTSTTPLIGASGAISGVMAMYLGVFRFKKIEFFYWFFIFVGYFRAPAFLILPFYIGKELYDYFGTSETNVAFMAHVGGFVAGAVLMVAAYLFNPKMLNEDYIEEDQDLPKLQQDLAKVYDFISKSRLVSALKSLDAVIKEYGLKFEWLVLRFNLLKMQKNDEYKQVMLQLMQMNKLQTHELDKLEKLWNDNTPERQVFTDDDLYKFGWNMANSSNYPTAEKVYSLLKNKQNKHKSLATFAKKLAVIFAKMKNQDKQHRYEEDASKLINELN